jgi:general secretion pathway protein D
MINQLVDQLDTIIDQVLIEVVIAEMSLTDDLNLGVEMYTVATPSTVGNTVIQGSSILNQNADNVLNSIQNGVFPNGLTFGVARGTSTDSSGKTAYSYPAVFNINALKKNGKFKILSSVPLLSQNNREASVSVVNNIPILKSTISGGSGTARDIIQNIDRYDVGIKLKMTPHVNPDGQVNMVLNPSIEAIIDPGTSGSYTPTIAKREVSTTITVPDGQTIVITGLIREDETDVVRKVPILGDIPLIRFFFTNSSKSKQRTNLLIFVTPHLIKSVDTARSMTASMEARTGLSSSTNATPVR